MSFLFDLSSEYVTQTVIFYVKVALADFGFSIVKGGAVRSEINKNSIVTS